MIILDKLENERLGTIETDIKWIKKTIEENNNQIKILCKKYDDTMKFFNSETDKFVLKKEFGQLENQVSKHQEKIWKATGIISFAILILGIVVTLVSSGHLVIK